MKKASELTFADSSAFPLGNQSPNIGLTKREYFAAMAMQGLMASDAPTDVPPENVPAIAGFMAVLFADALIAALNAEPKK